MKKRKMIEEIPKYKLVVPYCLCLFMLVFPIITELKVKESLLLFMAIFSLVWFGGENIFPDNVLRNIPLRSKNKFIWISGIIFIICLVLSEIFSKDYGHKFDAYNTEYESWLVLISYFVIFIASYNCFYFDKCVEILKKTVLILVAVIFVMSLLEFFDISIATLWIGEQEKLEITNRVMLCFGNSNYYGGFCCMMFPFVFEAWLWAENRYISLFCILLNVGIVFCVIVSKSTLAFYLLIVTIVVLSIFENKRLRNKIKEFILLFIVLVFFLLSVNALSGGKLASLIGVSVLNDDAFVEREDNIYELKKIEMTDNKLTIYGNNSKFSIICDKNIIFYDSDGDILDAIRNGEEFVFDNEEYRNVKINLSYLNNTNIVYLEIDIGYKDTIDFYIVDGLFKGVGANGEAIDSINGKGTESWIDSAFTGRGYSWTRTLPKLREVLFIGKGTGNFVYNYEQYDYLGLIKTHGTHKVIVNRPHNIFLQYSMDIGVVGTLALCTLVLFVIIQWMKNKQKYDQKDEWISQATFFSVVIFSMFSMFNDSMVVLTPYMWIFLGVNMSLQYRIKKA